MGVNISTERLTFINLTQYESFSGVNDPENGPGTLDQFMSSPIGEAQVKSLQEEMAAHAFSQGVENYEATDIQIRRALHSEQAAQGFGREPDVTNEEMLDEHGPSWYEELGGALVGLFSSADEAVGDAAYGVAGATVDHVESEGMTGQAAEAISGREKQINDAVDQATNGTNMKM